MTNDKYYTPSIEEFHVGFEYIDSNKNEIFDGLDDSDYNELLYIDWAIKNTDNIKVKYLDSEDLESLGYQRTTKGEDIIWRNPNNISVIIEAGYKNGYIIHNGTSTFRGIVRNKSELKQVLRMLRVQNIGI
jgi:hypothetical protein